MFIFADRFAVELKRQARRIERGEFVLVHLKAAAARALWLYEPELEGRVVIEGAGAAAF